ncbi:transcription elongation factor GreA [Lentilactobacillus senioris]|uniref:Transcription elongation factor GreA n=1 Tax=Lentilactobacillus senioris DSM 24302 = JCM 17472 TaxID=1423802 RepID=A0A0R2D1Y6_9LACO|nr:transcription elongation factor GreA [Lentilactobacillus senioris]KRM94459.1 prokaryotic transcription elongation factor, GreA GreB domain protein [Lentilactobacillus senioris DSM 24302 = JCM 17472]
MDPQFNPITQAGYDKLTAEINQLETDRPNKIAILQAARALGDLSENAEYSAAKRDLRHLESRLRFLRKQQQYARVVTPSANSTVEIGNLVTVQFTDDLSTADYQLVGTAEVDIDEGKISIASPLGKAIRNHQVGDTVTVKAPDFTYQVKIMSVNLP